MNSGHADRVNPEQPGQVSRTNYDKIKNVEFKTIIHCQSRNKEGNSISQISFICIES